ncbi:MAG: diaminopimelate epimerase [Ruminococcus sp.]|nr:diaminopimelate epimerase [Ruminococcus sp.]MDY2743832.1 diaminopimelate epimerase [Eubacteriales bacterium]
MKFTKMQAYCNDYVYVITFDQEVKNPAAAARFVSDRHKGVGSDGMILICPSAIADFRMRVFNPDGSEAEMCGNALRSTGKLVYVKGLTSKTDFTVETLGGIKKIHLTVENGDVVNITANIGRPIFDADRIPVTVTNENNALIGYDYTILDRIFNITALSLGNPHCAVLCDDIYSIDIAKYGHALECSPIFPNKANIHFYDVTDRENIRMIAWERNCGETLACATGCCTCVTAANLAGLCDSHVNVHQKGGIIVIDYDKASGDLVMTGKSEIVFDGEIDDRLLTGGNL